MSANPDPTVPPPCILYAEDEEDDIFFFQTALETIGSPCLLKTVSNGEQAINYLSGKGAFADRSQFPLPDLVLLDINMPKRSGLEVLKWIRQQPHFKTLPVVLLTSSNRAGDSDESHRLGAEDYLIKPSDPAQLSKLVKAI